MGTIYRIHDFDFLNNHLSGRIQLPDKNYVDEQYKKIMDTLKKIYPDGVDTASLVNDPDMVDIDMSHSQTVSASNVTQDSEHRFITDNQITLFRNKPSLYEVEDKISIAKDAMRNDINKQFVKLLNNEKAVERLRVLADIIKSDDVLNNFMSELADTITVDELTEHAESHKHLNNIDRNALNILLDLIKSGKMDDIRNNISEHAKVADVANTITGIDVTET